MQQPPSPNIAPSTAELLELYLHDRDCACPGCGYNLRNLCAARCPECAMQIELAVRLTEPRQTALIAGLIGLAAGAGFSALLSVFAAYMLLYVGRGGGNEFPIIVAAGTVIEGAALWLWLRSWKSIRRKAASTRILLATLCWILTAINLVVFIRWVR